MSEIKKPEVNIKIKSGKSTKSSMGNAAQDFVDDGKKLAQEAYMEGLNKLNEAEANLKEYSDELLVKIKKNPITSVLVAAGVGFLLSSVLRK